LRKIDNRIHGRRAGNPGAQTNLHRMHGCREENPRANLYSIECTVGADEGLAEGGCATCVRHMCDTTRQQVRTLTLSSRGKSPRTNISSIEYTVVARKIPAPTFIVYNALSSRGKSPRPNMSNIVVNSMQRRWYVINVLN